MVQYFQTVYIIFLKHNQFQKLDQALAPNTISRPQNFRCHREKKTKMVFFFFLFFSLSFSLYFPPFLLLLLFPHSPYFVKILVRPCLTYPAGQYATDSEMTRPYWLHQLLLPVTIFLHVFYPTLINNLDSITIHVDLCLILKWLVIDDVGHDLHIFSIRIDKAHL